jgi:outer membrane protein assembly factor BamD (BamD/ComL family)
MKARFVILAALAASVLIACAGAPKAIPEDLSARELVQRAQECSDAYNYKGAIAYYKALDQRFGSDPVYSATAAYEIAFINYKEGHLAEARKALEGVLALYSGPDGASYPPHYQILATKVIEEIDRKTKAAPAVPAGQ